LRNHGKKVGGGEENKGNKMRREGGSSPCTEGNDNRSQYENQKAIIPGETTIERAGRAVQNAKNKIAWERKTGAEG